MFLLNEEGTFVENLSVINEWMKRMAVRLEAGVISGQGNFFLSRKNQETYVANMPIAKG